MFAERTAVCVPMCERHAEQHWQCPSVSAEGSQRGVGRAASGTRQLGNTHVSRETVGVLVNQEAGASEPRPGSARHAGACSDSRSCYRPPNIPAALPCSLAQGDSRRHWVHVKRPPLEDGNEPARRLRSLASEPLLELLKREEQTDRSSVGTGGGKRQSGAPFE